VGQGEEIKAATIYPDNIYVKSAMIVHMAVVGLKNYGKPIHIHSRKPPDKLGMCLGCSKT